MTWPRLLIVFLCLTGNGVLAQDLEDWFIPRQRTEEQQRLIDTSPLGSFENPVRAEGPVGQRAYLARLRCPSGEPPEVFRRGSSGAGPYGTILDGYSVTCTGTEAVTVFMDLYHTGFIEDRPVPGFAITEYREIPKVSSALFAPAAEGFPTPESDLPPCEPSRAVGARVHGSALDRTGALVPGMRIMLRSDRGCVESMTDERGDYSLSLSPGVYRLEATLPGACPIERAAFRVEADEGLMINVSDLVPLQRVFKGLEQITKCFAEETRQIQEAAGEPGIAHVAFASKSTGDGYVEYRSSPENRDLAAILSFGALSVAADSIRINLDTMALTATGKVAVDDGVRRQYGGLVTVDLSSERPVETVRIVDPE